MARANSYFKIDMLVLSILKQKDCYGYEMVKLIRKISNNTLNINESTLYPIVYTLLKQGYITSREKIINRRNRVYYHIEQSGIEYLENTVKQFRNIINGVFDILAYEEKEKQG